MKINVKKLIILNFLIIHLSCNHKIVRMGYAKSSSVVADTCMVFFAKGISMPLDSHARKGTVRLKESGFSVTCNSSHAFQIMKKEACMIGANVVVITEEKMPDVWSSCYRCTADMYAVDTSKIASIILEENSIYSDEIEKKKKEGTKKNTSMILGGVIGGVVAGITVGVLSKK